MSFIRWIRGMLSPQFRAMQERQRKSREELDWLLSRGFVEKVLVLPAELGGPDEQRNRVHLPPEPAARKREFDAKVYRRVESGQTLQYQGNPEYDSDSWIPARVQLSAATLEGQIVLQDVLEVVPYRIWEQKVAYPPDLTPQIEKAMTELEMLTTAHDSTWQIGKADWSVDQEAGTITFTSPKGFTALAPVQIIGSYNTDDLTWLWSWKNPSVERALTEDARKLRSFGQERGYEILTKAKFICPEAQCWELAALARMLGGAQGAYSGTAGATRVFVTFGKVKLGKTQ